MAHDEKFRTIDEVQDEIGIPIVSLGFVSTLNTLRTAALIILALFITAVAGLIFLPWVQTVHGSGRVVAYSPQDRAQFVQAPVEGRITRWYVSEGSLVKEGDLLVEITDIDPDLLERIQQERDAGIAKVQAFEKSLRASQKNVERQRNLYAQGLSSRRAVELAEIEEAKFASDIASASAELARNETKLARQRSQRVTALRDGMVQSILAPEGGIIVKEHDLLAQIVPDTEQRAVELWIDGNDLPIVSIGRAVRLQFEGWPAVQFSGWPSVAVGTFGGVIRVIDPSDNGKGKFRVLVVPDELAPWPETRFLRQGVRAIGWVMLDSVSLGWELWRRFNAFPVTASSHPPLLEQKK
jgi:multidrug efflux pump subunit AcrA (membrane-fusion protein)